MALTEHEDGSITDEVGTVVVPASNPVAQPEPAPVDNQPAEPEKPAKTPATRK